MLSIPKVIERYIKMMTIDWHIAATIAAPIIALFVVSGLIGVLKVAPT